MTRLDLVLPYRGGELAAYSTGPPGRFPVPTGPLRSRVAYSAAHVVCDPLADTDPILRPRLDWEATIAYRRYLWSLGLAVAEAMDTAQRGMGLDWETAKELIAQSVAEARSVGGTIACGAGTDQLAPGPGVTLDDVEAAYEEQCAFVDGQGVRIILMASRALAACARGPDDYRRIYDRILSQARNPVILHWLGDMFDPALVGYWGSSDLDEATETFLALIKDHEGKVDGVKISLLDPAREIHVRRRLPPGVHMYTGDDFNYVELIGGDDLGHSHALLGIFDPIAPAASAAIQAMDAGDIDGFRQVLEPTLPLSRHIFQPPTYFYKTGVVFLAYLNGHHSHFRMVGGYEGARSILHLSELFILADKAGLLRDPGLAVDRMRRVLALAGIT